MKDRTTPKLNAQWLPHRKIVDIVISIRNSKQTFASVWVLCNTTEDIQSGGQTAISRRQTEGNTRVHFGNILAGTELAKSTANISTSPLPITTNNRGPF